MEIQGLEASRSKEAFINELFDDRGYFDSAGSDGACAELPSGYHPTELVDNQNDIVGKSQLSNNYDFSFDCENGVSAGSDGACAELPSGYHPTELGDNENDIVGKSQSDDGNPTVAASDTVNPWIPVEGMVVESVIEAFIKYSDYARRKGFEIRFRSSDVTAKSKQAMVDAGLDIHPRRRTLRGIGRNWLHDGYEYCSKVRLQCVKGEKWRSNSSNPSRLVRTQATNCKAGVYLTKNGDGSWNFRTVRLEHNHECDPKSTRFMRSYRIVSGVDEMKIVLGDKSGVAPSRGYMNFVVTNGGIENVPFSLKDSHSVLRRWRKSGIENGDFNAMQEFFNQMKRISDDFFYSYDTDGEGRLKNVFWADARSRAAHQDFGDVVCFDTTHLKNRYKMPLAPFIGVNHHGQSILLGCALLSNEDADSFKWVFDTWLTCMHNNAPKCIMTDQCKAIGKAVSSIFPNARHRWCLWHVMRNAESRLRKAKDWVEIRKDLADVVHCSFDSDEFEGMWLEFITKFKLEENKWLNKIYQLRERWVPAFFLHEFWAGLRSTQRSEGMNNFFRSYVNINTGLKQFVEQYCLAIGKRADDEAREDWKCKNKPVRCATVFKSEEIFQRLYTIKKFVEFQCEVKGVVYVNTERVSFDGVVRDYLVTDKCTPKGLGRSGTKQFVVTFDVDSKRSSCACKMFEFKGLICRHIVAVWKEEELNEVPAMYILNRWRKDIFRISSIVTVPNHIHEFGRTSDEGRCSKLQGAMKAITDLAMSDDVICDAVMEDLEVLTEKCKSMLSECSNGVITDALGRQYRKHEGAKDCDDNSGIPVDGVLDPVDCRGRGRVPLHRKGYRNGKRKSGKRGPRKPKGEAVVSTSAGGHIEGALSAGLLQLRANTSPGYYNFFT